MNPLEHYSLKQLRQRTSEKWRNYDADVLPLWVAEMDVKLPDVLIKQLHHALSTGDVGYLSKKGFAQYATAFTNFTARHWGWEHEWSDMVDTHDVVTGCRQVIDAWLEHNPDNSVIISTPIYPPFINSYTARYTYVDVPLTHPTAEYATPELAYRLDFAGLEQAFKQATSCGKQAVYALCNPSNPTGTVHTATELRQLAILSSHYNVLVVSDEIHAPLVTKRNFQNNCEHDSHTTSQCHHPERHGKHSAFVPYLSLAEAQFAVTVISASKAFSIPGMKAALIVPSAHRSGKAQRLIWDSGIFRQASSEQLGAMAQTICLNECDEWLYHLVQAVRNNLTYFETLRTQYLNQTKFISPEGTYFAWVDFSNYVENGVISPDTSPHEHILQRAKVAVNPGRTFTIPMGLNWSGLPKTPENALLQDEYVKSRYDNFVRVNLATSQEIIRMAVEKIGEVL